MNMIMKSPHQDYEIGTDKVTVFSSQSQPPLYWGLNPNGSPFGVGVTPPANGAWDPALQFSNWVHGAGVIDEQGCNSETSASDLLAKPGSLELLKKMDRAVMALQAMGPWEKMPAMPSVLVQRRAQEELAQRTPASASHAVFVGAVAGAFACAMVAAAALKFVRTGQLREPLISDDA